LLLPLAKRVTSCGALGGCWAWVGGSTAIKRR
jgi:hypothetical protein